MSAMKESIVNEAIVDFVCKKDIITDAVCVKDLPLQTISIPQLDFVSQFKLTATKQGTIYALVGWFDTWFTRDGHDIPLDQEGSKPGVDTFFTTGAHGEDTHWKQTIFVLDNPIAVVQGKDNIEAYGVSMGCGTNAYLSYRYCHRRCLHLP
jgi:type I protein arginine methyltransferase